MSEQKESERRGKWIEEANQQNKIVETKLKVCMDEIIPKRDQDI